MMKQILHHMKRMLDLGTNAGTGLFKPFLLLAFGRLVQCAPLAWAHRDMPGNRRFQMLFTLLDTLVPSIPESQGFVTVQQRLRLADVADIPC